MTSLRRAVTILCLLLFALIWLSVSPTVAAGEIVVNNNEATSDFPDGINFTLDVEGEREITRIELLYQPANLETLNLEVPDFEPSNHVDALASTRLPCQLRAGGDRHHLSLASDR